MIMNTVSNQLLGTVYKDPTWDLCSSGILRSIDRQFGTNSAIFRSQAVQECQEHLGILLGWLDPSTLDKFTYVNTHTKTPLEIHFIRGVVNKFPDW